MSTTSTKRQALFRFLSDRRTTKHSDTRLTHATMDPNACGSFHVSPNDYPTLLSLLAKVLDAGEKAPCLIEQQPHDGLMVLDFDFRGANMERKFGDEEIEVILRAHNTRLDYFDVYDAKKAGVVDPVPHARTCYVMMRKSPYVDEKTGSVKDGIHIVIKKDADPYRAYETPVKVNLRNHTKEEIRAAFEGHTTNSADDFYDEAVVSARNGWIMYGGGKPGREPYKVASMYSWHDGVLEKMERVPDRSNAEWVETFALRKGVKEGDVDDAPKVRAPPVPVPCIDNSSDDEEEEEEEEEEEVQPTSLLRLRKAVMGLGVIRYCSGSYEHWSKVLFAIMNEARAGGFELEGEKLCHKFSKQGGRASYDENATYKTLRARVPKVRMGTIMHFLEVDDPVLYAEMTRPKAKPATVAPSHGVGKDYPTVKREFEERHFKVGGMYATMMPNGEPKFFKRGDFHGRHEHLKCLIDNKPIGFIDIWMRDPEIQHFEDKDFCPPPLQLPSDKWYNTFRGFAAERITDAPSEDISPFLYHLDLMCGDPTREEFQAARHYLLRYVAHMFQFPGEKPNVSVILFGDKEGEGKSLFIQIIGKLLGESLHYETGAIQDITGNFSVARANRILVQFEEAEGAHTGKVMALIKLMITSEKLNATDKYEMQRTQHACDRLMVPTNNNDCISASTQSRRFVVLGASSKHCRDQAFWKETRAWYKVPANLRGIYEYLMKVPDVADKDWVGDRPRTQATLSMSLQAQPPLMHFLAMVTQLNVAHEEETLTGKAWFDRYRMYEESAAVPQKERLSLTSFGMALGKLSQNAESGVTKPARNSKGVRYTVSGYKFTSYAESLGLTECCDLDLSPST
jgi:Family of unknown function (DUF5906)